MTRSGGQPRVLIVAENASARFGGEAILPLHYFRVFRKRGIDAWLIVHDRTRDELTALFPNDLDRIHFIPDTRMQQWMFRFGRSLRGQLRNFTIGFASRLISQRQARRLARELVAKHRIDIVHQPTPVSPKESSLLYNLGAPLVMGPMNGGMAWPPGFRNSEGKLLSLFMRGGRWFSGFLNGWMPGKLRADVLLVANDRTQNALPRGTRGKVLPLVENGVDLSLWTPRPKPNPTGPTRFIYTGRLVDWKAVDVLLDAFAIVAQTTSVSLDILGSGPMRASLESQSSRLQLSSSVTFHGWVAQAALAGQLREADVLVLPSLYECGGAVVLEAMACALPVIASNWGGPADYLDSSCGILVTPITRDQFVNNLAETMIKLAEDPGLRLQLGTAGRKKAEQLFDWERKADAVLAIYDQTIKTAANHRNNPGVL